MHAHAEPNVSSTVGVDKQRTKEFPCHLFDSDDFARDFRRVI